MKFVCDSCSARYFIDDAKVRGKVLRIRCKKCSHVITVRGPADQPPTEARRATQAMGAVGEDPFAKLRQTLSSDAARRVSSSPRRAASPPPTPVETKDEWHYSAAGETFGPYSEDELIDRYQQGRIGDETYVWREGFDAWRPASTVPVFATAIDRAKAARRKAGAPATMQLSAADVEAMVAGKADEAAAAKAAEEAAAAKAAEEAAAAKAAEEAAAAKAAEEAAAAKAAEQAAAAKAAEEAAAAAKAAEEAAAAKAAEEAAAAKAAEEAAAAAKAAEEAAAAKAAEEAAAAKAAEEAAAAKAAEEAAAAKAAEQAAAAKAAEEAAEQAAEEAAAAKAAEEAEAKTAEDEAEEQRLSTLRAQLRTRRRDRKSRTGGGPAVPKPRPMGGLRDRLASAQDAARSDAPTGDVPLVSEADRSDAYPATESGADENAAAQIAPGDATTEEVATVPEADAPRAAAKVAPGDATTEEVATIPEADDDSADDAAASADTAPDDEDAPDAGAADATDEAETETETETEEEAAVTDEDDSVDEAIAEDEDEAAASDDDEAAASEDEAVAEVEDSEDEDEEDDDEDEDEAVAEDDDSDEEDEDDDLAAVALAAPATEPVPSDAVAMGDPDKPSRTGLWVALASVVIVIILGVTLGPALFGGDDPTPSPDDTSTDEDPVAEATGDPAETDDETPDEAPAEVDEASLQVAMLRSGRRVGQALDEARTAAATVDPETLAAAISANRADDGTTPPTRTPAGNTAPNTDRDDPPATNTAPSNTGAATGSNAAAPTDDDGTPQRIAIGGGSSSTARGSEGLYGQLGATNIAGPSIRPSLTQDEPEEQSGPGADHFAAGLSSFVQQSIQRCHQRHVGEEGSFPMARVELTLVVEPNGRVSSVSVARQLSGTPFERCLQSHRERWTFGPFSGDAVTLQRPYVLQ